MKNSVVIVILILLGFYLFRVLSHDMTPVSFARSIEDFKEKGVPHFHLESFDPAGAVFKGEVDLSSFHKKVMLVNFWATWCAPCVEEFPALIKLAQKNQDNLEIFAVALDKDKNSVKKFVSKMATPPSNFHILIDPSWNSARQYGTNKIPETYIIDAQHKLIRKSLGDQNWLSGDFEKLLQGWIKGGAR